MYGMTTFFFFSPSCLSTSQGELATKMQQLKQYKKQADHLRDELSAHKEVHAHQKEQVSTLWVCWSL